MQEVFYFELDGETPAKKNSRITLPNGRTIPSKKFQDWHKASMVQLSLQRKPIKPIDVPVAITLSFYHGDLRRRDSDNGTSSIMDLLVDAKILSDDNWQIVRQIDVFNYYEKNRARCRVTITAKEDSDV